MAFNTDSPPLYLRDPSVPSPPKRVPPEPPKQDTFNVTSSQYIEEGIENKEKTKRAPPPPMTLEDDFHGRYQCHINADVLNDILIGNCGVNEKNKQFSFTMWNVLSWKIQIKLKCNEQILVYIRPIRMTKEWKAISVCIRCYCPETLSSYTSILKFENKTRKRGIGSICYSDGIFVEEIRNEMLNELQLWLDIRILKIEKKGKKIIYEKKCNALKKESFKWVISSSLWQKIKSTQIEYKCFESEIFNDLWCLRIYPMLNQIELILCVSPQRKQPLHVYWNIFVKHVIDKNVSAIFKFGKTRYKYIDIIPFSELKHLNQVTINFMLNIPSNSVISVQQTQQSKLEEKESLYLFNSSVSTHSVEDKFTVLCQHVDRLKNEGNEWTKNIKTKVHQLQQQQVGDIQAIYIQLNANINQLYQQFIVSMNQLDNRRKQSRAVFDKNVQQLQQEMHHINVMEERQMNELKQMQFEMHGLQKNRVCIDEKEEIKMWLTNTVKLPQYFGLLVKNGYITIDDIVNITDNELKQIGIDKMGHRRKMVKHQSKLINNAKQIESDDNF